METTLNILATLVILLGSINLVRMGIFLVGSDVYGVINALHKRREKTREPYLPSFSVVIPAHNEQ